MRPYTAADTLRIAKRYNNPKRSYLLVNPLQAKHIPVSPTAALEMMSALGGQVEEGPDFLTVRGGPLTGGTVDSANDHRIAMAAAIAATGCAGPVTVLGAECVAKSYPNFWEDYRKLGGITHEHPGT